MPKIQNVSGLYQSLPFSELVFFEHYKLSFEISELGRMKKLLPLHEKAKNLGLLRGQDGAWQETVLLSKWKGCAGVSKILFQKMCLNKQNLSLIQA